jgi:hypothetical protein
LTLPYRWYYQPTPEDIMDASQAQINFVHTLLAERDYTTLNVSNVEDRVANGPFSKTDASTLISLLLGCPRRTDVANKTAVPVGFYICDETVYRVVQSKQNTNNFYAKRLDVHSGRWEYAPGAIKNLADAPRLTVEVAARMGARYGICVICGRTLTAEKSVEAAIGPVCSGKL